MYTIYFQFNNEVGFIHNVMEDAIAMMEEIIGRRAMILLVEKQT